MSGGAKHNGGAHGGPVHTYNDRRPYATARGRFRPREPVESRCPPTHAVVDLATDLAVRLDGIVIKEARPGWLALDLPPLEVWEPALRALPVAQRERLEHPSFYAPLQSRVSERFLALRARAPAPTASEMQFSAS